MYGNFRWMSLDLDGLEETLIFPPPQNIVFSGLIKTTFSTLEKRYHREAAICTA